MSQSWAWRRRICWTIIKISADGMERAWRVNVFCLLASICALYAYPVCLIHCSTGPIGGEASSDSKGGLGLLRGSESTSHPLIVERLYLVSALYASLGPQSSLVSPINPHSVLCFPIFHLHIQRKPIPSSDLPWISPAGHPDDRQLWTRSTGACQLMLREGCRWSRSIPAVIVGDFLVAKLTSSVGPVPHQSFRQTFAYSREVWTGRCCCEDCKHLSRMRAMRD